MVPAGQDASPAWNAEQTEAQGLDLEGQCLEGKLRAELGGGRSGQRATVLRERLLSKVSKANADESPP